MSFMPSSASAVLAWQKWRYFISEKGVEIDPKKIEVISKWPEPKTQKDVRSFLDLTGYCRRFIRGYAIISKALTDLLKKDGFVWNPKAALFFKH